MKILICKPSSLGDVVQALALVRHIKSYLPDSSIYWWVSTALAPLLEHDPHLDGVFLFDRKSSAKPRGILSNIRLVRRIRRMNFDWVIDLQSLLRSAVFAWLCAGRKTIGLDDRREWAPLFYNYAVPRPETNAHAVDWYLSVIRFLGIPLADQIEWLPVNQLAADSLRRKISLPNSSEQLVLLQPCTRWKSKQWPLEYFIEAVRLLLKQRQNLRFAVMGSSQDIPSGEQIVKKIHDPRVLNLCGKLTLTEMVECIRLCDLMITGDTGPMHVAAALDRPLISLFGATNPHRTGPYGQPDSVITAGLPCCPCMKSRCPLTPSPKCMYELHPERIVQLALEKLQTK